MCRLINLARLLVRDNLPHAGWTESEAKMLQAHIEDVWLQSLKDMQHEIGDQHKGEALKVLKTHMIVAHATDRLLSHGGVHVRVCQLHCFGAYMTSPSANGVATSDTGWYKTRQMERPSMWIPPH